MSTSDAGLGQELWAELTAESAKFGGETLVPSERKATPNTDEILELVVQPGEQL